MRRRIRPSGRDEGFQKLRALRCFGEVYERLVAGWAPSELARFIQEDRNEYGQTSRAGLILILQRFRAAIPPAQLMAQRMPDAMHKAEAEVQEGLDELKEFIDLFQLQKARMEIDHKHEKNLKKLMPTMTQEVRVAAEILGKIADLKMDLGLSTRHLGQVEVEAKVEATLVAKYGKESVARVMADPEKRRKVLNVAERMLALPGRTEKGKVPAEDVEDAELADPNADPADTELDELALIEIVEGENE